MNMKKSRAGESWRFVVPAWLEKLFRYWDLVLMVCDVLYVTYLFFYGPRFNIDFTAYMEMVQNYLVGDYDYSHINSH